MNIKAKLKQAKAKKSVDACYEAVDRSASRMREMSADEREALGKRTIEIIFPARELERLKEENGTLHNLLTDCNEELGMQECYVNQLTKQRDRLADELHALEHEYRAVWQELQNLKTVLADPASVWINMLRGEIARPIALDHYEHCKAQVEKLEAENDKLRKWLY